MPRLRIPTSASSKHVQTRGLPGGGLLHHWLSLTEMMAWMGSYPRGSAPAVLRERKKPMSSTHQRRSPAAASLYRFFSAQFDGTDGYPRPSTTNTGTSRRLSLPSTDGENATYHCPTTIE